MLDVIEIQDPSLVNATCVEDFPTDPYQTLCEHQKKEGVSKADLLLLTDLLKSTLNNLVFEPGGPNKESAMSKAWDKITHLQAAGHALQSILDADLLVENYRLEYLSELLEMQLAKAVRMLEQSSKQEATTFIDRLETKATLEHLLESVKIVARLCTSSGSKSPPLKLAP